MIVPSHMRVLKKSILSLPQNYRMWPRAAVDDMVLNIIGFIPLGAALYGFLQSMSKAIRANRMWEINDACCFC